MAAVSITVVPWDDVVVARLRDEQQGEIADRYDGVADIEPDLPAGEMVATLAIVVDDDVVGCAALRDASRYGEGCGELKRMYVRPGFRGRGLSRQALATLERIATERGMRRLILETGVRQPEAIGLYRSAGYRRIPTYGPYVGEPNSVCYARWLHPEDRVRVLVVTGSDAGVAAAVGEALTGLLGERGVPNVRVVTAGVAAEPVDTEPYESAFDGAEVCVVPVPRDGRSARALAQEVFSATGWPESG